VGSLLKEVGVSIDLVGRLATVTVVLLLAVYAGVIISCFKLRGRDESAETFKANSVLLGVGLVGNLVLLGYVVYTDPSSLWWCAALIGLGGVLYVIESIFGSRTRPPGTQQGDPSISSGEGA
jgi:hypothetical protein